MYNIVEFIQEKTSGLVPDIWLCNDRQTNQLQSFWPNERSDKKIEKMAKNMAAPQSDWKPYDVRIIKKTDSWENAQRMLTKSFETSDLSEVEQVSSRLRKHRIPRVVTPFGSSKSASTIEALTVDGGVSKKRRTGGSSSSPYPMLCTAPGSGRSPSPSSDSSLNSLPSLDELYRRKNGPNEKLISGGDERNSQLSDHLDENGYQPSTSPVARGTSSVPVTPSTSFLKSHGPVTPNVRAIPRRQFVTMDEFNAFREMCASNFSQIKASQRSISGMLVTVLNLLEGIENGKSPCKPPQMKDYGVTFPLQTEEDYERVNEMLLSDDSFSTYLTLCLSGLGGDGVSDVTNGILRHLMTDELASRFNYTGTGTKNKRKFADSAVDSTIINIIVSDKKLKPDRKSVTKAIASWLRHVPDRLKYKAKKIAAQEK